MRSSCVLLAALLALAAYYVYIPLPGAVSDPWKLMLLDATFRGAQQVVSRAKGKPRVAPAPLIETPIVCPGCPWALAGVTFSSLQYPPVARVPVNAHPPLPPYRFF